MFQAQSGVGLNRWPVVRVGGRGRTEVVLLSTAFFSLTTHFLRFTVPCSGDRCALCEWLPARGLFYVACMCDGRVSVLELGAQSAAHLEQHARLLHQGLRPGLVFELSRKGPKSPVFAEVIREVPGVKAVELLTLAQRVLAIYKLPCCNPGDSIEVYERRIRDVVERRNEMLALQLKNSKAVRV